MYNEQSESRYSTQNQEHVKETSNRSGMPKHTGVDSKDKIQGQIIFVCWIQQAKPTLTHVYLMKVCPQPVLPPSWRRGKEPA